MKVNTIQVDRKKHKPKCWDIYQANIPERKGAQSSVYYGVRPVLIISNDTGNSSSPTINVYPFTTKLNKRNLPVHVQMEGFGLTRLSTLSCEQITTLSQQDLMYKMGSIDNYAVRLKVGKAARIQNPIFATI